jgi:hypothetical protein
MECQRCMRGAKEREGKRDDDVREETEERSGKSIEHSIQIEILA